MIVSMTGYGSAERCEDGLSYALEVRSLNNRYFKASIKMPDGLQFLEPEVDKMQGVIPTFSSRSCSATSSKARLSRST